MNTTGMPVESRMRGNVHVRFGRRLGETDRPRGQHRAPSRPNSQIQALNRTQPILPVRPGLPEKATHDYKRNGTTTLFAALEIATGAVTDRCYERHGKAEFLDFLKRVARAYPRRELHIVLDNYHTHKHDEINQWLAKHPRITLHFTPTSGSWLNLVERWFAELTNKKLRRGAHRSARRAQQRHPRLDRPWNENPRPYIWTKTAEQILDSLTRYCRRINNSGH